jgi:hypothetical protein
MATFDLLFDGKAFPVPKKSIFELLDHDRSLMDGKSYAVQSSVPLPIFEAFVSSLNTQSKISVTQANAVSLSFLAKEFFLSEIESECATFSVPVDQFLSLADRVSALERQMSSVSNPGSENLTAIEGKIESQEEGLQTLRWALEHFTSVFEAELGQLKSGLEQATLTVSPCSTPEPKVAQGKVEIPMKEAGSVKGIISYLTTKHGGNVHEKHIVAITAKSVGCPDDPRFAVQNVGDLTSDRWFMSDNEPDQWVCWDFGRMRIRPTHYAVKAYELKSWVVEGSQDGESWTELDRQTDKKNFKDRSHCHNTSFAVSHPEQFRFVRLTQTEMNWSWVDFLNLFAVEFFGTLFE